MNKLYDRIYWHNNTTPALNETNLNSMSKAIDDIDDRVVEIAGDIMTTIPQLEEDLAEAQELIDDLEDLNEHTPYIGANGNWWVWNTTTKEYEDSGVDASISVQIADITMLAPSASPYVTNTGTSTDPIFHLFIPRGNGVDNVAKTSTSGLTDTYTMTFTDGTTYVYSVVNGKGISSISKTSTSGLVDTYTITYNDNTTTTFTVTNGKTAYQAAQEAGYSGTESEFNTMLASVQTYATSASQSASAAEDSAEDAEAWAVGTRDGSPVPSTDPTYHNNAKYWSDEAQHTTTLDGLSDVTITSPQNNDALVYDSATQSWKNGVGGSNVGSLDDLTDVTITNPDEGQSLIYNSVMQKWINNPNYVMYRETYADYSSAVGNKEVNTSLAVQALHGNYDELTVISTLSVNEGSGTISKSFTLAGNSYQVGDKYFVFFGSLSKGNKKQIPFTQTDTWYTNTSDEQTGETETGLHTNVVSFTIPADAKTSESFLISLTFEGAVQDTLYLLKGNGLTIEDGSSAYNTRFFVRSDGTLGYYDRVNDAFKTVGSGKPILPIDPTDATYKSTPGAIWIETV